MSDPGNSDNIKQDEFKKLHCCINCKKSEIKKKSREKPAKDGKHLTDKGGKIRITHDFSESMQAIREWSDLFNVLIEKEKNTKLEFCIW